MKIGIETGRTIVEVQMYMCMSVEYSMYVSIDEVLTSNIFFRRELLNTDREADRTASIS